MTAQPAVSDGAVERVLAETWPILLDFDGPVTHLFINGRNRMVADQMRQALPPDMDIPVELRDTPDPLVILRWVALHTSPDIAAHVDQASTAGEVAAVAASEPTHGARILLEACADVGRPTVVVSNNAEQAIEAFLKRFDLRHLVQAVIARIPGHPELMKPHPSSIERALDFLLWPASQCVLIGDSVSDIQVSHATGVRSIGHAKHPARGRELHLARADAVTHSIADLADQVRSVGRLPRDRLSGQTLRALHCRIWLYLIKGRATPGLSARVLAPLRAAPPHGHLASKSPLACASRRSSSPN